MRLAGFVHVLVLCLLFVTDGRAAKDPGAARLAGRVEDLYKHADTFHARFQQTFVHRASKKTTKSKGTLAAATGGLLSFRYAAPKGNRVVSDGKRVKLYEKSNKTMYVMRLKRARHAFAVAFLTGEIRLVRDFRLRLLDPERKKVKRGAVLEAIPKKATPLVSRLLLYVDLATAQVLRVMVVDVQGNTNRFDFTRRKFGEKLKKGEFTFRPPRGTRVVHP